MLGTLILAGAFEVELCELLDGHRHIFSLGIVHDSVFGVLG